MPRPSHSSRFITRTILGEQYRSLSYSICRFLHSQVIVFVANVCLLPMSVCQREHNFKTLYILFSSTTCFGSFWPSSGALYNIHFGNLFRVCCCKIYTMMAKTDGKCSRWQLNVQCSKNLCSHWQ
jgi:hypothetical protein